MSGTLRRPSRALLIAAAAAVAAVTVAAVAGGGHAATPPTFTNFAAPPPLGADAGEPSIGANWSSGNVMFQAGLETLRVSGFDDATGTASWTKVGPVLTSTTTLDPILFTDHGPAGRSSPSCRRAAA